MRGAVSLKPVGEYFEKYNRLLELSLPCGTIFQSAGLPVHVQKRHREYLRYVDKIPDILESPDYIGKNPAEPDSIEFVKRYEDNILVAVKLDIHHDYLDVASLYDIKQSKLERRIYSGRLISLDNA